MLTTTFAWAAGAKIIGFRSWRQALLRYRLAAPAFSTALVAVPVAELAAAGSILTGAARAGSALVIALLSSFSWAVMRARSISGDRVPCGCFGGLNERDYRAVLLRNAGLGLLAAVVLIRSSDSSPLEGFSLPGRSEFVPAALVVFGVVAIAWLGWYTTIALRNERR